MPAPLHRTAARSSRRAGSPRLRLLVLGVAVLAVVGLGSTLGYRELRDSSLFAMHDVVVTGANPALTAQVQAAVRASVGHHSLLALGSSEVARSVTANVPGVHSTKVDRDFPSTLRVTVVPERPVAIAVSGHDRVVVSATGRVLAVVGRRSPPPNLPRLGLPGHGVPKLGARLENPTLLAQLAAVSVIPAHFGARVGWIRQDPDAGIELELHSPHLLIRLGPAVDLREKLQAARLVLRAYPTIQQRSLLNYVDVSAPARPAVMPKTGDPTTLSLVPAASSATTNSGTTGNTTSTAATSTTTTTSAALSTSTNP
ncbi:MAG: FtsQ-type POTRA domain-containing protein [Gaiellales bacterium]